MRASRIASLFLIVASSPLIADNQHYPAAGGLTCVGQFTYVPNTTPVAFSIEINVGTDSSAILRRRASDSEYNRDVRFDDVIGVSDAHGRSIFTGTGFSLTVVPGGQGKTAQYAGSVGIGAWAVQDIYLVNGLRCQ